jgi:ATP-binding cassette, subfamily B, bacterial
MHSAARGRKRPRTLREALPGLRRVARHLWPYLREHSRAIAAALAALFAGTVLRLLEPWPLKLVFDHVLTPDLGRPAGRLPLPALGSIDPMSLLGLCALAVVIVTGLRALTEYITRVSFSVIANRVLTRVRNELYRHLQRLSLSFHSRSRTGDLTIRVISDVNMLRDATVTAVLPLMANGLILLGMWGVMLWMQWRLALLALLTLPLLGFSAMRTSHRIHEAARKQRHREGDMASTAAESIGAMPVVQALSLEEVFARDFAVRTQKSSGEDVKATRLSARLERSVDVLLAVATALVLWFGARLVVGGLLSAGDLLVFLAYLKRAFNPVQDFAKYTGRLAKAAAAGERVVDLFEQRPEIQDPPHAAPGPPLRGAIRFEDVCFGYGPSRPVLDRMELQVQPGQRVALVGPSGIGKSTIAHLLLRLYDPQQGRITVDGRDLRELGVSALRSQISVVLQDTVLFAASVRDNIAYGAPHCTAQEIEAAARLADAHELIEAMPEGYETILGERGVTLSGGQRQRIAIARAAIRSSPILILDEPTTGLDEESRSSVVEALERLSEGRTTFIITHDLELGSRADLILYLQDGRVLERGSHVQLLRAGGQYARLYRLQSALHRGRPEPREHHVLS